MIAPEPVELTVSELVEAGRITQSDAADVLEFAAFLRAAGPPRGKPLPVAVLREHQHLLGVTDEQLAAAEAAERLTPADAPQATRRRTARERAWDAILRGVMDARGELGSDPSEETSATASTVMTYLEPLLPDETTVGHHTTARRGGP